MSVSNSMHENKTPNLPLDILWNIFKQYPKTPCTTNPNTDTSSTCECLSSSRHLPPKDLDSACPNYIRELLALRVISKDFSIVIKQLVFQSSITVRRKAWITQRQCEITSALLDAQNGDGGITIRECIRSIQWKHTPNKEVKANIDQRHLQLLNSQLAWTHSLPNLSSLYITHGEHGITNPETKNYFDDFSLTTVVAHYMSTNTLSTLSLDHISNVPIHTLLSNSSLYTLILQHSTFATCSSDPMKSQPDASTSANYNLRNLTITGGKTPFLPLLPHLPKLQSLIINIAGTVSHTRTRTRTHNSLDPENAWAALPPQPWSHLEVLKFCGNLIAFDKMFKVGEADRVGMVLFPRLSVLEVKDEPEIAFNLGATSTQGHVFDDQWVLRAREGSDFRLQTSKSLEMACLKRLVIDQTSCTYLSYTIHVQPGLTWY
ncbi:hypothetical protein CVT24_011489 [Panaeolus cyanescens]|uniref:Uncharacterized protein n=1 Tax=Panaeolus cyanescens TaxID=181874 RepID=A0A409WQI0_9AGAR|nr:hypothetical protein CVT24_011489 [Panaeolus cyanescens]